MAIQVRRGNEADFDASKMLPGEWAVSLDTRYVRMCFSPGLVLRMATYESFEADMAQIQSILAECRTIQSAVQRIQAEVNLKASITIEYSNSAKESADRAYSEAERAKTYANNAEAVTGVQIATMDRAGLVKGGDNYIAEDGTLTLIKETTAFTMPNSYDGRLKVEEIGGVSEQETTSGANLINQPCVTTSDTQKHFLKAGTYTVSKDESEASGAWYLGAYDESGNVITESAMTSLGYGYSLNSNREYWYGGTNSKSSTFTIAVDCYVKIGALHGSGNTYLMLNAGTEALPWEPYTGGIPSPNPSYPQEIKKSVVSEIRTHDGNGNESVVTLSQPIELYGIGDVQDVIDGDKIVRKFANRIFNGSESWNKSATLTGRYLGIEIGCKSGGKVLCTQAKRGTYNSTTISECYLSSNSGGQLIINTEFATVAEWKAHLAEHPMTVVYELAEEVIEDLPLADQIALNSLSTYDGITYLEFVSEIQPTFKGEYGTSKVGGYTLEGMLAGRNGELMGKDYANRITALEATVVNNI